MGEDLRTKWLAQNYNNQFESDKLQTTPNRLDRWRQLSPADIEMSQPLITGQEFEDYDRLLGERGRIDPVYGDIDEQRAQAQTGTEKLGMMLPRTIAKIATEIIKMPGEVAGLAEWAGTGFDIDKFEESVNNKWTEAMESASEHINDEWLPVYKRRAIEEGGFFKQITSPEFWATEGADGIGFLVSMMGPGIALRAAGLGQKIVKGLTYTGKVAKFGQAGKLTRAGLKAADNVNDWTSAGANTLIESLAEGKETMEATKQALYQKRVKDLVASGHTEQDADMMAQEYIESEQGKNAISKAGYGTFMNNLAILMVPNVIDQKWLFRGFRQGEAVGVLGRRTAGALGKTDDVTDINRLTTKQLWGKAGERFGIGVAKEGFFEEGMQFAASELEKQRALDPEKTTNILEQYVDNLGNTDMQKSIFLGAMLGGVMGGIGGYRSGKREDEYLFGDSEKKYGKFRKLLGAQDRPERKGVIDVFKNNFVKRYQSVEDLYKKNEDGELILDENNEPEIDTTKLAEYGVSEINDIMQKEQMKDLLEQGDKEGFNYIKSIRDFKYMIPFIKEEGGYELLKDHIDKLAKTEFEALQKTGFYKDMSVDEIKKDLLTKAAKINNIYKKGESTMMDLFKTTPENKKYARQFSETLFDSYLSSEYILQQNQESVNRLGKIVGEISSKGFESKPVTSDKIVPGHIVKLNGAVKQIIQSKEGVLKTIDINGIKEEHSIKDTDTLELVTNISPVDRKQMFDSLLHINNYNSEIESVRKNYEKLFNEEGQQKAFDQYVSQFESIRKKSEQLPTEEKKLKVEEAVTKEELDAVEKEVEESDLSESQKKNLKRDIKDKKTKEEHAEAKVNLNFGKKSDDEQVDELAKQFKEKKGFVFDEDESEVDRIAKEMQDKKNVKWQNTTEQLGKDTVDDYEIDRKQEGKDLDKSENKLEESEYKTPYVNIAYLAIKYEGVKNFIRTKLDKNKNIVFGIPEHSIPSITDAYAPGTKLIMFIDDKNEEYNDNKDDINSVPIAIQSVEDYEAKKPPYLYVHKMDWITPLRVADKYIEEVKEQTLALRKLLVESKVPQTTFVLSKTNGWLNKPDRGAKEPKQLTIRELIGTDPRVKLGIGERTNTLWTDGSIDTINGNDVFSGIPYVVLPTANGNNFAVWLKQEPIKNNPNFEKYNKTVVAILEAYVKGEIGFKNLTRLRDEVGKYYHVNTDSMNMELSKIKDQLLANEDKNFIFHLQESRNGELTVVLPRIEDGKISLWDYKYKNGKWIALKNGKKIEIANMSEELGKRIPNKYPNYTKQGIQSGNNFEVFELIDNKLQKVKKSYIDFLSENRVVTTSVQPNIVNNTRTYFSQPNIRINTNLDLIKPYERVSKEEEEETISDNAKKLKTLIFERANELAAKGVTDEPKYDDMFRDLDFLGGAIMPMNEFIDNHKKVLLDMLTEEELESFREIDNLFAESEKILNFEQLLKQLESIEFTDKQLEEAERIEKYCKGLEGKGSKFTR